MKRLLSQKNRFFPWNPQELKLMFEDFWDNMENLSVNNLKWVVAPHAWIIYSGQVAAYSYEAIRQNLNSIPKTIFIMTPDHYIWLNKVLVWNYDSLEAIFWDLQVDKKIVQELLEYNELFTDEYLAYDKEHALETQLIFLSYVLWNKINEFKIVSLIFGWVNVMKVYEILNNYKDKAFFIISSDLSHYNPYEIAIQKDKQTIEAFLENDLEKITTKADACWIYPWATFSLIAKTNNYKAKLLKYLNSWDTAWDKSHVVGYASLAYYL